MGVLNRSDISSITNFTWVKSVLVGSIPKQGVPKLRHATKKQEIGIGFDTGSARRALHGGVASPLDAGLFDAARQSRIHPARIDLWLVEAMRDFRTMSPASPSSANLPSVEPGKDRDHQ
jgi:hypothetical protein